MKHLNILNSCGCAGEVTDSNENEIDAMIGSGPHEEDELDDDGNELTTNEQEQREVEAMFWVVNHNQQKPSKD